MLLERRKLNQARKLGKHVKLKNVHFFNYSMAEKDALISSLSGKYEFSKELDDKMKIVEQQIIELQTFEKHLETLENNTEKEMLAPIGKGVYIKSAILDRKLFIDVGAGVIIRKDPKDALKIINNQIKKLSEIRTSIYSAIETSNIEMQHIIKEIEKFN